MSRSYGFNLRTLSCRPDMRMDEWTAIFGPNGCDSASLNLEHRVDDQEEEAAFWFPSGTCVPTCEPKEESCNPNVCRMSSGICVDCARCWNHCICAPLETPLETPSSLQHQQSRLQELVQSAMESSHNRRIRRCDPTVCRQLICGDCSRCVKHCECQWETSRPPLRTLNQVEDAFYQGLNRKRSNASLKK